MNPHHSVSRLASILVCAALVCGMPPLAFASAVDGRWVELGAPARTDHSTILDPVNERLIQFGGRSNVLTNTVHALSLADGEWSQIEPLGTPPAARSGHAAIYDPLRQRMLVFGGATSSGTSGELWALALDGTPEWTLLAPSGTPPAARTKHRAIYDPVRDRMVIHGGESSGAPIGDVWALSLSGSPVWSEVIPAGPAAPARQEHAATYDPVRDRLIVFGGYAAGNLGDTRALDFATNTWSEIAGAGPSPRRGVSAVHDPVADALVIVGGIDFAFPPGDVWSLPLGGAPVWSQLPLYTERWAHGATWVPSLGRILVTAGYRQGGNIQTDVLALELGAAPNLEVFAEGGPGWRTQLAAVFDPDRDRLVIFGGDYMTGFDSSPTDQTWGYVTGAEPEWALFASGPSFRARHTLVRDPTGDRMILFGGHAIYGPSLGDTWSFDLETGAWTELVFAGATPGATDGHTSVYDPIGQRMLMFGGYENGVPTNELWQLDLAGTPSWSLLAPSGMSPAPRANHVSVFDPLGNRMLMFGGAGSFFDLYADLWELSLGGTPTWTLLAPAGVAPTARFEQSRRAVYDPVRQRMIVLGRGVVEREQHQLVLGSVPRWAPLLTTGPAPQMDWGSPLVFDAVHDRLLTFGANFSDAILALELEPQGTAGVTPAPVAGFALRRLAPNPSTGAITVSFDIPSAGDASVEVVDLAGRRVAARALAALPPGLHHAALTIPNDAPPGIYFVRVGFAGRRIGSRVALVR
jgi:hypothetical protein